MFNKPDWDDKPEEQLVHLEEANVELEGLWVQPGNEITQGEIYGAILRIPAGVCYHKSKRNSSTTLRGFQCRYAEFQDQS